MTAARSRRSDVARVGTRQDVLAGERPGARVAAVVVDYDSGPVLAACVASLVAQAVAQVVVVDNGAPTAVLTEEPPGVARAVPVRVVRTGANLGYGAGANRGVAAAPSVDVVLVMNPDVELHPGAVDALVRAIDADPAVAVVGPRVLEADGSRYPSARRFPSPGVALVHALVGRVWPDNRFSSRYRMADLGTARAVPVDWVSGACFAVRRQAWEELGGFDEAYFMYAEDMDLCWRARQAGWDVVYDPSATVTHLQGVSTRRHPYAMLAAHHRSALRFTWRTQVGWRRLLVPGGAAVLAARMVAETVRLVVGAAPSRRAVSGVPPQRLG
ncbi:MAG: glycosyltransferase family 2 protein [Actinomycetota bacterium]|nr:glycosyltransferase family 2 protein [Actinomycetota bacterium]MDA8279861.1 glycosyltransferase family 2 protein [Actinomycetota bacterium]